MPFKRGTEEERAAREREKEAQREQEQQSKAWAAFQASPAGQARAAFERGDRVFQYSVDVVRTQAVVVPMTAAMATSSTNDPTVILNSVCNEGWDLVNGSFVFHELGSESRDKFMASGQQIAVKGTVIGYYLFKRCEENRVSQTDVLPDWAGPVPAPVHRSGRMTR